MPILARIWCFTLCWVPLLQSEGKAYASSLTSGQGAPKTWSAAEWQNFGLPLCHYQPENADSLENEESVSFIEGTTSPLRECSAAETEVIRSFLSRSTASSNKNDLLFKISRICAVIASVVILAYCANGFKAGSISIKGVKYTLEKPVAFAFGIAMAATFAIAVLGLALAYPWMMSPIEFGPLRLLQGIAAASRVILLFVTIFVVSIILTFRRMR